MKKLFILAMLCLPLLFFACSRVIVDNTVTINGFVCDSETGEPLANVLLTIVGHAESRYTGDDGNFTFPNVEYNDKGIILTAKKSGYKPNTRNFEINRSSSTYVHLTMEKE
ncbi:MAG: carboxypeptidase regulatory-like domain-containing protein [Paludibacteraceae bacterium]|nr:carboxypeptidase regulatory-like domain-containing protein [Paludibacteraceae bacterium]